MPAWVVPAIQGVGAALSGLSALSSGKSKRKAEKAAKQEAERRRAEGQPYRDRASRELSGLDSPTELWEQGAYDPESQYSRFSPILTDYQRKRPQIDRIALSKQRLADFDTESAPGLEERYRGVGQRAATLGRIGSGMTTNDLTGLSATHDETDYSRATAFADEARGERGYKDSLGREGLASRITRWEAGQGSKRNKLQDILALYQAGQGGNMEGFYSAQADRYGSQGASASNAMIQGLMGLGEQWGDRGQKKRGPPPSAQGVY